MDDIWRVVLRPEKADPDKRNLTREEFLARRLIFEIAEHLGTPAWDMGMLELHRHHKEAIEAELIKRRLQSGS